jgi:hypothetical protein
VVSIKNGEGVLALIGWMKNNFEKLFFGHPNKLFFHKSKSTIPIIILLSNRNIFYPV